MAVRNEDLSIHSLIIGGTRGIGRELVRLFRKEGHTVSVIGKREPGNEDKALRKVHFWSADVTRRPQLVTVLNEIVQRNGNINYLVFLQRFRGDGDKWVGELGTSLTATKNAIEMLAERFATGGDKAIVVVGSIADQYVSESQPIGYHVAKAGLVHLACYYAVALGAKGIRVNCVSPSTILKRENRQFYENNEAIVNVLNSTIPLGRMGTATDTANVIAFLCSPQASFVTGQRITVDGGVSLLSQESLARRLTGL